MKFRLTALALGFAVATAQATALAEPMSDRFIVRMHEGAQQQAGNRAQQVQQVLQAAARAGIRVTHWRRMGLGAEVVRLSRPIPVRQAQQLAERLGLQAGVEWVAVSQRRQRAALPNDPEFTRTYTLSDLSQQLGPEAAADLIAEFGQVSHLWYLQPVQPEGNTRTRRLTVNWQPAWERTNGFSDRSYATTIAIIDTGIVSHSDLAAARILPGYDFIHDDWTARDGDGRDGDPGDEGDWSDDGECAPYDSSWHGTFVAGVVGATANNGTGLAGINPGGRILPVRVLGKCGGYDEDIIDGALWAAGLNLNYAHHGAAPVNLQPADVVNFSLGGEGTCGSAFQAMLTQLHNAGVVSVAAAGNARQNVGNFAPANCAGMVTVAATSLAGALTDYSNYGAGVTLSAPGGGTTFKITSTSNAGRTGPAGETILQERGTSFAAPLVTGAISLIQAAQPGLSPDEVHRLLRLSASPFPAETDCTVQHCGAGVLDVDNAVQLAASGLSASVSSLSFRKGLGLETLTQLVALVNNGDANLTLPALRLRSLSGAQSDFAFSHDCPAVLAPGGRCTVTVRFEPTAPGGRYALLEVPLPAATLRIALFGRNAGSVFTVEPVAGLTFSTGTGGPSAWQTAVLRNSSAQPLTFDSNPMLSSSMFTLGELDCDGAIISSLFQCLLPPGGELRINVRFQSATEGDFAATLSVRPLEGNLQQIALQGTAAGSGGGGGGGGEGGGCTTGGSLADLSLLLWPALFWLRRRR